MSRNVLTQTEKLAAERRSFTILLGNLVRAGEDVWYLDESQFQNWSFQRKAWSTRDHPIHVYQNQQRHSCSVIGAIGAGLRGGCYFSLHVTFNKIEFRAFIRALVKRIKNPYKTAPILVLDNHRVHIGCLPELEKHFRVLRQPAYSCQLNSIERCWARAKVRHRSMILERREDQDRFAFSRDVRTALELPEEMALNYLGANRAYMERSLRDLALEDEDGSAEGLSQLSGSAE